MKKVITNTMLAILLLAPVTAFAEQVSFDPNTPEGRKAAYAALNEQNTVGNANRLIRSLKSFQRGQNQNLKSQADTLIPQLTSLVQALGGTVQTK